MADIRRYPSTSAAAFSTLLSLLLFFSHLLPLSPFPPSSCFCIWRACNHSLGRRVHSRRGAKSAVNGGRDRGETAKKKKKRPGPKDQRPPQRSPAQARRERVTPSAHPRPAKGKASERREERNRRKERSRWFPKKHASMCFLTEKGTHEVAGKKRRMAHGRARHAKRIFFELPPKDAWEKKKAIKGRGESGYGREGNGASTNQQAPKTSKKERGDSGKAERREMRKREKSTTCHVAEFDKLRGKGRETALGVYRRKKKKKRP